MRAGRVTRRDFGGLTAGAGLAMLLPQRGERSGRHRERTSRSRLPTASCDAYFVHPSSGAHAAVLVWPDILGLRPAFRQMGKRLAESGYSVLVVNPFYRAKARARRTAGRGLRRDDTRHRDPARAGAERDDARQRREGVHRVARPATVGRQEPQDRHDGLLHGRADHDAHGGGRAGSRRRRGVVPRRRARHATTPTARTCWCRR